MGILNKLFGKKENIKSGIVNLQNKIQPTLDSFIIHSDLKDLLWVADGPRKNYVPKDKEQAFEYNGIRISFSSFSSQEPSLISTKLPIKVVTNLQDVETPSYYPTYTELTDEQRGVYWKLLENPYSGNFNIGYVFVLYYGLERHLLEGDIERAFRVILKLRDVYDNSSFQKYSACSLILTCLTRQRADLVVEFYNSIDKNFELNFSDNLYMLCKMGLNIPLTASDIIRMSKTFEFSKQNYIKKYPDLFNKNMCEILQEHLGTQEVDINKYITVTEWKKIRKQATPVFANMSIQDQAVDVPLISENFKFKKVIYDLLEQTHERVKSELVKMRKDGTVSVEKKVTASKSIEVLSVDMTQEQELISQYKKTGLSAIDKHFALIALQDFYYKYREIDEKYLQFCVNYCNEDIALLPDMQLQYIKQEKESIQGLSNIYSKREIEEKLSEITAFDGNIPAFKRLSIIFEKRKDYRSAIQVCDEAIEYYKGINRFDEVNEFEQRRNKIKAKISKI